MESIISPRQTTTTLHTPTVVDTELPLCQNTKSPVPYVISSYARLDLTSVQGTDEEATYRTIHDELALDGQPLLNLASFVHTWMPKAAETLVIENMYKNLIDQDEYPMTRE